jgi:PKD repeat protein
VLPPKNTTVYFTDLSEGGPVSWLWSFSPSTVTFMNGTSETSQHPEVRFINGGLYTVTLTVNNLYNPDTETKIGFIHAGIPGLWIGNTSTDWNTSINWDDDVTPNRLVEVLITEATAPVYWPYFNGNFSVGSGPSDHCHKITFDGAGCRLTVNGNLNLKSGHFIHVMGGGTGNLIFE